MTTRELSESNENFEKDLTLNAEAAQDDATATAQEMTTPVETEKIVENQVENQVDNIAEVPQEEPAQNDDSVQKTEPEPLVEPEPVEVDTADEPQAETEVVEKEVVEEESLIDYNTLDKTQLVAELEKLLDQPVENVKDKVALIKGAFFAIRKEEIAKEKALFLEDGNEEEAFVASTDELETKLKEKLGEFKEKRAEFNAEQEAVRLANLEKKNKIIEEINTISQDPDNINRQFLHVQQLQQEFKSIGEVPSASTTEVWKAYQQSIENFYDLLKINKELRDYDFKKNLEIKQRLCEEAEALDEETDVIIAFKKLQALHDKWRETGPVAKDIREQLWARFKNASSVINKKHQAFFEERKASEKENAEAKTALCEAIEKIETDGLKTYAAWDEVTKQIISLQEEWKKLGFASRKVNSALFTRFRKSCDEFFAKKAAFFKSMKDELANNLAKKTELCEKAEALKDSTDWKSTTDALIALQKEWKTIGPVVKKHSDAVWKRFITACDYFFEEKKKQTSSQRSVEHDNLKAKKELIAEVNKILQEEENSDEAPQKIRDLMAKWQTIGHVPYKEKDKIYAAYKEAIDKAFEKFDMKAIRARLTNFENTMSQSGSDKVYHERERLVRAFEQKCNELKTYENNMGFFTARSQSGNTIVKEMERKIAALKDEIALLEQKIKIIDEKL